MLIVEGTLTMDPSSVERAIPTINALVQRSRAEPGCIEFVFSEEIGSPGTIRVFERWESRTSLDTHQATNHVAQWRKAAKELDIARRNVVVYADVADSTQL